MDNYPSGKAIVQQEAIEHAIDSLEEREKYLFRMRYIEGKPWDKIIYDMNYSHSQVFRSHGNVLKKQGWM